MYNVLLLCSKLSNLQYESTDKFWRRNKIYFQYQSCQRTGPFTFPKPMPTNDGLDEKFLNEGPLKYFSSHKNAPVIWPKIGWGPVREPLFQATSVLREKKRTKRDPAYIYRYMCIISKCKEIQHNIRFKRSQTWNSFKYV